MELLSCGVNVDLQSFQLASDANLAMMVLGRNPKSYYERSDEGAGQKMELAGTRPTYARAQEIRELEFLSLA